MPLEVSARALQDHEAIFVILSRSPCLEGDAMPSAGLVRTSKTAAGKLVPARQFIVDGGHRGSTRANGVSNGSEAAGEKSNEPGRDAK